MTAPLAPAAPATPETLDDRARARSITLAVKAADREMRERFGFLRHQDALGVAAYLVAAGTFVASGALFLAGVLPAWATIAISALAASILREIEHDLIHNLYFAGRKGLQNLMMAATWPFLGNLPHPWFRRKMHLLHHKTSGTFEDFEERLIGNGMPFGPKKLLAMVEPGLAMVLRRREMAEIPFLRQESLLHAMVPVTFLHMATWVGFLLGNAAALGLGLLGLETPATLGAILGLVNPVAVVWVLPNVFRQVCLQILSSNMHYYADVGGRTEETQVMNAWVLFPLNLFAFNFGSTHTIHHFMVNQPFYLRQMIAKQAHAAFRANGVRFNDLGTILRGNRVGRAPAASQAASRAA
jgi:fatty acid desaturase